MEVEGRLSECPIAEYDARYVSDAIIRNTEIKIMGTKQCDLVCKVKSVCMLDQLSRHISCKTNPPIELKNDIG